MLDIADKIWGNNVVTGEKRADKPKITLFKEGEKAIALLNKWAGKGKPIAIHCDVDMDGIGSGYITGKFIQNISNTKVLYVINREKEHGIQEKHAEYFNNRDIGLMIIVDSSSNDLEIIKKFNCDVLVIDHHEIEHSMTEGKTNNGSDFIIVNNTIDNSDFQEENCTILDKRLWTEDKIEKYNGSPDMSCGLVVYELLRLYEEVYKKGNVLEDLLLYQWVGVTLFTDSILLNNKRNQWYIENTVYSQGIERTLGILVNSINKYDYLLSKSIINYKLAPLVNSAIRASQSMKVLDIILHNPKDINKLEEYRTLQKEIIEKGINNAEIYSTYVLNNLSDTGISKNYAGVIASRLCGDNNKNTLSYIIDGDKACGSFRGKEAKTDYLDYMDSYSETSWARGHRAAFGFTCSISEMNRIMENMAQLEEEQEYKYLITAGKLNTTGQGRYQIENMEEFKRGGGLWKIAIGNSRVSTEEVAAIAVNIEDMLFSGMQGKVYMYSILGLVCKAFEPVTKKIIYIYPEYTTQIEYYIK